MAANKQVNKLYGLIGYPLSHSFSQCYFTEKFEREGIADCAYELYELKQMDELPALLAGEPRLRGLNVTIPYKEAVIPYLDEVRAEARGAGAVNTIDIRDGQLTGYNTDVYGFEISLRRFLNDNEADPAAALVLGSGGAAKAVNYTLDKMGIRRATVSRSRSRGDLKYEDIGGTALDQYTLIINTTPLGMAPNIETFPILPYEYLTPGHLLFDLVYNPGKTIFLEKGERQGCAIKNGLEMLYLQAERAWAIWNTL
jgi:shikimate dehydrogenase